MVNKPKFYSEFDSQKAINEAIDDTSIEDDVVDQYHEAAMDVLTGKIQARTAANTHNLDLKLLESLLQLARKKLDVLPSKENLPTKENEKPKKNNDSTNDDLPTTSSKITEKPKSKEKVKQVKEPKQPVKRKSNEEVVKKKEKDLKEDKNKKNVVNVEESSGVTVRKKRRKLEDVLQQEAREQVFRGSNDPDSEALALALKVQRPSSPMKRPLSPMKTRSSKNSLSINHTLKALTWNDKEQSPTNLSSSSSVEKDNINKTGDVKRAKTNVPSTSNAIVPYHSKSTKKAIPMPSIPHEDVTISPTLNENFDNKKIGGKFFPNRPIPTNPRWQDFPTVIENLIDHVLKSVTIRKGEDPNKKINLRAAILDMILLDLPGEKASINRKISAATIRKYCRDVKILLEEVLGEDVANKKFFENLKDKENMTVVELKEALNEFVKDDDDNDDEAEENLLNISTITTNTKKSKKLKLDKSLKSLPKEAKETKEPKRKSRTLPKTNKTKVDEESLKNKQQENIKEQQQKENIISTNNNLPPNKTKQQQEQKNSTTTSTTTTTITSSSSTASSKINWGLSKPPPTSSTSSSLNKNSVNNFDAETTDPSLNNNLLMATAVHGQQNAMLLAQPNFERKILRGTKEEIMKSIKEFLDGKYSGSVDQFAEVLSTYISADAQIKKMMVDFDIPQSLFRSGYTLLSRYFKLEEVELIT